MIPKKPALEALTSLRFFAALAIVVHHCNGVFWPTADLGPLDAGVSFFFVLSGFILAYVYHDPSAERFAWRRFYVARLARIWPLHLVCLLLMIAFVKVPEPFDAGVLLANGLMLHAWIPFDRVFFSYNYASWSISTELFFYLLFPFVLRCGQWMRIALLVFFLAIVLALAIYVAAEQLPVWDTTGNELSSTGLLYSHPLARCAEFLIGVIGGTYFMRRSRFGAPWRWTMIECVVCAAVMLGFVFFWRGGHVLSGSLLHLDSQTLALLNEWISHVGLAPFAALLIFIFAHQRGYVSRGLSQRWFVFLGEMSFALYLVHQLSLRWLQQLATHLNLLSFGGYMFGIIGLASALHVVVEKPARQWLTRRFSMRAEQPATN